MEKNRQKFDLTAWMSRNFVIIVMLLLTIYATIPLLSPVLLKIGATAPGAAIQKVYSHLCHQRVDRSLFVFAEDSLFAFYTVDELRSKGAVPPDPGSRLAVPDYREDEYGYPYWGDERVGYKVAYCIRDTALYTGLILLGWILIVYNRIFKREFTETVPIAVYAILLMPMVLDGIFQTVVELTNWGLVPDAYIDSIEKRIITGVLFGFGFALYIVRNLSEI